MRTGKIGVTAIIVCVVWGLACRPDSSESGAARPSPPVAKVAPGDEPLETASVGVDEVQMVPTEKLPTSTAGRPCGWSSAWRNDSVPNPLLAGVGGVPMPHKTSDAPVNIPVRESSPTGELVAEIVIDPEGRVIEATILRSLTPRWAEAEDALLAAARQWRYEPPELDGTPISVCSTILMQL